MTAVETAQIVAAGAACVGLIFAGWQLRAARTNSKELLAKQMYFGVLKLPIECDPKQSLSPPSDDDAAEGKFTEPYKAYMRATLFACEEILELAPTDVRWETTIGRILRPHSGYLRYRSGKSELQGSYSAALTSLIDRLLGKKTPVLRD